MRDVPWAFLTATGTWAPVPSSDRRKRRPERSATHSAPSAAATQVGTASVGKEFGLNSWKCWRGGFEILPSSSTRSRVFAPASTTKVPSSLASTPYGLASTSFGFGKVFVYSKLNSPTEATDRHS